jgi:hypothetical protein
MVSPFHFKLKKNLACEKWNAKKEGQEKKACDSFGLFAHHAEATLSNNTALLNFFPVWLQRLDGLFPAGSDEGGAFSGMGIKGGQRPKGSSYTDPSQLAWLSDGGVPVATKLVVKLDGPRPIEAIWDDMVTVCWPRCVDTLGKDRVVAGLGLSDQKSAARRDHAHRNRLQNLY